MKMTALYNVDEHGYCPAHGIRVADNAACPGCRNGDPAVVPSRRLNVGCGDFPLLYWTNLDESPTAIADLFQHVPPLPFADGVLHEIYAGHFLEHLSPDEAKAFLIECRRCLMPGGKLGVVVPDTREILRRYLNGDADQVVDHEGVFRSIADLDEVCALFLYSTVQESRHQWSYDARTLRRLLESCGFIVDGPIDRFTDPRIPVGAWYQAGWDCHTPEAK